MAEFAPEIELPFRLNAGGAPSYKGPDVDLGCSSLLSSLPPLSRVAATDFPGPVEPDKCLPRATLGICFAWCGTSIMPSRDFAAVAMWLILVLETRAGAAGF